MQNVLKQMQFDLRKNEALHQKTAFIQKKVNNKENLKGLQDIGLYKHVCSNSGLHGFVNI